MTNEERTEELVVQWINRHDGVGFHAAILAALDAAERRGMERAAEIALQGVQAESAPLALIQMYRACYVADRIRAAAKEPAP